MRKGFTLVEVLLVISIIIVLLVYSLLNIQKQIARANDAKRKNDLYSLRAAIEEYKTDRESFPLQGITDNCGADSLSPYLASVPCDPVTRNAYGYFISSTGGYRVCAILVDTADPDIEAMGCAGPSGCGLAGGYNYCLVSGTAASAVGTEDETYSGPGGVPTLTPTGIPTPTPTPSTLYHMACTSAGDCNWYDDPYSSQHNCGNAWETTCPGYISGVPFSGACGISGNLCSD